jgi:hypothetical protein
VLRWREEPAHHGLDLAAGEGGEVDGRHLRRGAAVDSAPRHLVDERPLQIVVCPALALDDIARPVEEVRIVVAGAEIVLDGCGGGHAGILPHASARPGVCAE